MKAETIIREMARACAADAVQQGLRPDHLTPGWDLAQGDLEALTDAVGHDLTAVEVDIAREAFEAAVLRETEPPTYTVRPLGGCAWASGLTSLELAREARAEASSRGLRHVVIVDDQTGEVVPDEEVV